MPRLVGKCVSNTLPLRRRHFFHFDITPCRQMLPPIAATINAYNIQMAGRQWHVKAVTVGIRCRRFR